MRAPSRHSFKKSKGRTIATVLGVAVIALLLGITLPFVFTILGRIALYPVHVTQQWFQESTGRFPMYLKSKDELLTRIESLENELAIAAGTDLTKQRLYEENIWLRQLLGVNTENRIAAAVIARPTELPYDLMQIDQGEVDGIKVGAPVYIGLDNVIGVVTYAAPRYAFVQLFTSPGFAATAFISGADVMTTLEGYGGGVARVSVPQGISLGVGNLVYVPSIDPGVFGRVEYVENRPSQPEQYGYVTLPKPVSGIHYVAVAREPVTATNAVVVEERVKQIISDSLLLDTTTFNLASTSRKATTSNATTTLP